MKKIIFIILLACCQVTAFAQQAAKTFTVSGTVVDETDTPGPEPAFICQRQGRYGEPHTDVDGKISLKVQKNDILVVSFLGYAPAETAITGPKSDLRIKLTPSEHTT